MKMSGEEQTLEERREHREEKKGYVEGWGEQVELEGVRDENEGRKREA